MKRTLCAVVLVLCTAATAAAQDTSISMILADKEGWKVIAKNLEGISFLDAEANGKVAIYQGRLSEYLHPSGRLERVAATSRPPTVEKGLRYAVSSRAGNHYRIDAENRAIVAQVKQVQESQKLTGLNTPTCLTLWPDQSQLVIAEADGAWLWTMRIEADGELGPGDRYYSLRTEPGKKMTVTAMVMDTGNLLYAATPLGVQVFDPTGRLCGVILPPAKEEMTAITIGGEKGDTLFVAAGDKVYSRKIQGKAVYTLWKDK